VDGWQHWRRLGDKKFYESVPFPPLNASIVSGHEWSELPRMVGTELNLKIQQAPDAVVGSRTVPVFQYAANIEDRVCSFRPVMNFGFFQRSTTKFYECHGEVWMDESGIILRISKALELSGPWFRWWGVMTYGWLRRTVRSTLSRSPLRRRALPPIATLYLSRACSTTYKTHRLPRRAPSFKSLYLRRPPRALRSTTCREGALQIQH